MKHTLLIYLSFSLFFFYTPSTTHAQKYEILGHEFMIPDKVSDSTTIRAVFCHHVQSYDDLSKGGNNHGHYLFDGTHPKIPDKNYQPDKPEWSWENFAGEVNCAQLVWNYDDDLASIEEILNEAAIKLNRPELSEAPIVLTGLSRGGSTAIIEGMKNPDRVVAIIAFHGVSIERIIPDTHLDTRAKRNTPVLYLLAGNDSTRNTKIDRYLKDIIRPTGALWGAAMQIDIPHHHMGDQGFVKYWVQQVMDERLPARVKPGDPVVLNEYTESKGVQGTFTLSRDTNGPNKDGAYFKDATIARGDDVWWPNESAAKEWLQYCETGAP